MKQTFLTFTLIIFVLGFMNIGLAYKGDTLYEYYKNYKKVANKKKDTTIEEFGDSEVYVGYLRGLIEAFQIYGVADDIGSKYNVDLIEKINNVNNEKIINMFGEYLKNNPEKRHHPGGYIFVLFIEKKFGKENE